MTLDELLPLGMDILVLKDNASTESRMGDESYELIDQKWVSTQNLREPDDTPLKEAYDEARTRYLNHDVSSRDWRESDRLYSEVEKRGEEYRRFRPSLLAERIKNADLVIAPRELADKLVAEMFDVRVAILEDPTGDFELRIPATQENYPRVLFRTSRYATSAKPRIDEQTINLLFKQRADEILGPYGWVSTLESSYKRIDPSFYNVLERNQWSYANPVTRSTITVHRPPQLSGRSLFDFRVQPEEEEVVDVPVNYYGMGARQHGYMHTGNRFLTNLRERKTERIKTRYENLWTQPLDSVAEVLDRQTLVGILLENPEHLAKVKTLEAGLNQMIEPYIHVSNMSKLISANILRSRWGALIHKDIFYKDFTRIASGFIEDYEQVRDAVYSLYPESREMQVLLAPAQAMFEEGSPLDQTYRFLKESVGPDISGFEGLQALFEKELRQSGASKLEELEQYDPRKDSEVNPTTIRERENGSVSLRGYKSPYLKGLLQRFHSQNPVTRSEEDVDYLDHVGSKLAAYTAMAKFIVDNEWTRPEILLPEEGVVNIRKGWYPLTRLQHSAEIVRNDTYLDKDERVEIIDGINIGGKTIDAKKTLFIVCCALAGNYVPAEHARVSFFDRVRFRIKSTGMYDTSALVQELDYLEGALEAIGTPILISLDETFTSTNYREGEAMTYGLVRKLAEDGMIRAIITSHYPTLPDILEDPQVNGVKFSHFEFERRGRKLQFPHKKMQGPNTMGDYAIVIGESQQIPDSIIGYARGYVERNR